MTPNHRRLLLCAAGLSAIITASSAHAQQADEIAVVDGVVEELVVTAQKREQQAVDVPIALTAYSGKRLEALGVQGFADLSLFTPGFEVQDQSPNNPGFVMRGITSDSADATSEARVSVFQDGVSISKAAGSLVELYDIERVEVAKGPQSTLYGRGALIGAVNVIQAKANPGGFDAQIKAGVGNYNLRTAEGFLNLPFGDQLAVRLAGRWRERDGYVNNILGGEDFQGIDTAALRLGIGFEPNDDFRADLILNWQQDEPGGTAFKSIGFAPTNPATGQVLGGRGARDGAALASPAGFVGGPLGVDRTVKGASLIASWDFNDSFTLTSITAHREFDSRETFDPDGISLPILTGLNSAQDEQWSQEFRINFDNGGRFKAFAGGSWFANDSSQSIPLQFDERMSLADLTGQLNAGAAGSGLPASTPAPAAFFSNTAFTGALVQGLAAAASNGNILLSSAQGQAIAANLRSSHLEVADTTSDLESIDLFVDGTFAVTDRFEVSAGLRYTRDDKETGFGSATIGGRSVLGGLIGASQLAASGNPVALAQANAIIGALQSPFVQFIPASLLPNFGLTFQPTANNGDLSTAKLEDEGYAWRLVGRYALNDDANLYASYARGRRPEILAASGPAAPYGAPRFDAVEAETVDSYEVGAKGSVLDGQLRLDGSVYYYDYQNFQTVIQQGTLFVISNAGAAKAYGFEGQAEWRATADLDIFATYAYSHARFDGGAFDGNQFRLSPDHSLSIGASWSVDAFGGTLDIRPSYSWQSEVFFDDNNDLPAFQQPPSVFVADNLQDEKQDSYGLLNLRAVFKPAQTPVTFEVFVNNILDEDYIIDAGNTGDSLGLPTFIAGPPTLFGATISWTY